MGVYNTLLRQLVPERCPRCRGPTERGYCEGCERDFERIDAPCERCGLPSPVRHCPRLRRQWRIEAAVAPYRYSPPLYRQLHALKFSGARLLGRALGLLLAADVDRRGSHADLLMAVPLHAARLRLRGYNQAAEIARTVAVELGVSFRAGGVERVRATAPQSRLGSGQRRANIAEAFAVCRDVAGRRIAVVDDVITTGATVNALAGALLAAGAESVLAWSVARTLDRDDRSDTKYVIEQYAGEYRAAEPCVVQERPEATRGFPVPDQDLLIHRERRGSGESAVIPTAEFRAVADERETRQQRRL